MKPIPTLAVAAMLLIALTGAGSAAKADTVLRYAAPDDPQNTLVIEASADGDMRIEDGRGQVVIVRDGENYLLFTPPAGGRGVTRLEDYLAVGAEVRASMIESGAMTTSGENARYEVRPNGSRTIGKWRGDAVEIGPVDGSGVTQDIVISTDPSLADVRQVAVKALEAFEKPSRAVLIYPGQFQQRVSETLARGMPVSYDGRDLREVGRGPVAAARFELPQAPLTREQLRMLMGR